MRLPAWQELVEEQLEALERPLDESLFVVGPPGCGKTTLAIRRAQMVAGGEDQGPGGSQEVVFITYNRMLRRLVHLLAPDSGISEATMHRFVGKHYKKRTKRIPPKLPQNSYEFDWSKMLKHLSRCKGAPGSRPHVVVDEGQDLPRGFFKYVRRHVASTITVFADEDQALGDGCTSIEAIRSAANLSAPLILAENHRNTPEIARLAEHFHSGQLPAAEMARSASGVRPLLVQAPSLDSAAQRISRWYNNRGDNIGVIVQQEEYGTSLHSKLEDLLPDERVDYYTSAQGNEDSIGLLEPGVTILNRRSVKGQEFDTVFILQLESFIPCRSKAMKRALYMMCARARDNLLLVHGPSKLSAAALAALPGPDVLERETS